MPGFFWGLRRTSRGKAFGNEIADSLGIRRSHFHAALEEAGVPMHLIMLATLKDEGTPVAECREILLPDLSDGLRAIQSRFGPQSSLTESIETVYRWMAETRTGNSDEFEEEENALNVGFDNRQAAPAEVPADFEVTDDIDDSVDDLLGEAIEFFIIHWTERSVEKPILDTFVASVTAHPAYKDLLMDEARLRERGSDVRQTLVHLLTALNYLFMASPSFPLDVDHKKLGAMKKRCKYAGLNTLENLAHSTQKRGSYVRGPVEPGLRRSTQGVGQTAVQHSEWKLDGAGQVISKEIQVYKAGELSQRILVRYVRQSADAQYPLAGKDEVLDKMLGAHLFEHAGFILSPPIGAGEGYLALQVSLVGRNEARSVVVRIGDDDDHSVLMLTDRHETAMLADLFATGEDVVCDLVDMNDSLVRRFIVPNERGFSELRRRLTEA